MNRSAAVIASAFAFLSCAHAPPGPAPRSLERSNAFAAKLLAVVGAFEPEAVGALGIEGFDDRVADLAPECDARATAAYQNAEQQLRAALAGESDPAVRIDLELLADAARRRWRSIEVKQRFGVPDLELADVIFEGLSPLLDDQVVPERRAKALVRLRRYAGLEGGALPLAELAQARARERLARAASPFVLRVRVERTLDAWKPTLKGLREQFAKAGIAGAEEPFARLEEQFAGFDAYLRREVLPLARTGLRRPEELYAFELEGAGIDLPPRELAQKAREAFLVVQRQLQIAADEVAAKRGLGPSDYRLVLRALKKEQLEPAALAATYETRAREIEAILVEHAIVSLPKRPLRSRLATGGESAQFPAPVYLPPPLLSGRGESGTFVIPVGTGGASRFDDFSFEAASWWLSAHEGRPGHDLQFSRMVETGVSTARAVFAFNSANAEGWGFYAESLIEPYVPAEARLALLQARLMRAAHAFLDPELNLGLITPEEAKRVMTGDVVFSEAWANSCVQRYSVWMPGQAGSYFYGDLRLREVRGEAEAAWADAFTLRRFHDSVIAQGLVPHQLLRRAVLAEKPKD